MKDSIAICFQKDGILSEARLPETYQRALSVLTEEIVIPDEVEIEEDLGPIEDDQVQEVGQDFDIEVNQDKAGQRDDTSSLDGEDEEDDEDEEVKAPEPPKRQRKENTMIGFIRKGKYSK
jgi:hypothetical protein